MHRWCDEKADLSEMIIEFGKMKQIVSDWCFDTFGCIPTRIGPKGSYKVINFLIQKDTFKISMDIFVSEVDVIDNQKHMTFRYKASNWGRYTMDDDSYVTIRRVWMVVTDLNTNKIILENFKELMTEPESKTITLEQIFKKYCKYMAENVDTTNLEVNLDDGPHYESFECYCETENVSSEYSHYERYNVTFRCDDTVDDDDNKIFSIHLSRWKSNPEPKYDITIEKELNIDSLRYLNDFNVYLLKLARANIKITGLEDITEDVEPEAEPEASWS